MEVVRLYAADSTGQSAQITDLLRENLKSSKLKKTRLRSTGRRCARALAANARGCRELAADVRGMAREASVPTKATRAADHEILCESVQTR